MGMYDEFLPVPPIECPKCGTEYRGIQGKYGPCLLLLWKQGVAAPVGELADPEWVNPDVMATLRLPEEFFANIWHCRGCGFWDPTILAYLRGTAPNGVWTTTEYSPTPVGAKDIGDGWLQCSVCSDAWERIGTRRSYICCGCGKLAIVQDAAEPRP